MAGLERHVRQLTQGDPACRRMMSMLWVGAVVALTYRSAVDDHGQFTSSKKVVGPWVGLTPSRSRSGKRCLGRDHYGQRRQSAACLEPDRDRDDAAWKCELAQNLGRNVACRSGSKRALVALERRVGVILHRIWKDGANFRFDLPGLLSG